VLAVNPATKIISPDVSAVLVGPIADVLGTKGYGGHGANKAAVRNFARTGQANYVKCLSLTGPRQRSPGGWCFNFGVTRALATFECFNHTGTCSIKFRPPDERLAALHAMPPSKSLRQSPLLFRETGISRSQDPVPGVFALTTLIDRIERFRPNSR
jgi:hypothetical protein